MKKSSFGFLLTVVAIAGLAGFWNAGGKRAAGAALLPATAQPSFLSAGNTNKHLSAVPESQGTPEAEPATSKTAAMRRRFDTTSNYAAFIHDGMQRPSEGGRFYAWIAYNRCDEVYSVELKALPLHAESNPRHERAFKALTDVKARCAGVAAQFPDHASFIRALKSSNSKGVPDALLLESTLNGPSRVASSEALKLARMSGDPYLLAATLDIYVEYLAEEIDPAYSRGWNRPTLFVASAAAVCEIVGNCRDSIQLHIPCAAGGVCQYDDLRDFLRDSLDPEARALYEKTRLALLKVAGTEEPH